MNSLQHNSLRFAVALAQGVLILLVFLLSIDLLVLAFDRIGHELVQSFLAFTANPFVSLFIGLLVTAIVQSSSVTTSMFVALVASGSIGLDRAIPMVIGANIGTTLTSNLVAMSFIMKKQEFRNAFSAAVSHDFFNLFTAMVILPLEYFYQILSRLSQGLTRLITPDRLEGLPAESGSYPGLFQLNSLFNEWLYQTIGGTALLLALALVLLFFSVKLITRKIYRILVGSARVRFERYMFHNPYRSFGWGTLFTAGIQSSSVTTSLIVPLVATERVSLEKAFPFILGANLGTPVTALLAALFKTETAVSLALAHFMFNLIGVSIFLPFPPLRKLITRLAGWLGQWAMRHWIISLIYIILVFFLIPFAFISIW